MSGEIWDVGDVRAVVFDVGGVFVLPTPVPFREAFAASGVDASMSDADFHRAHYEATAALDAADEMGAGPEEIWREYRSVYARIVAPGHGLTDEALVPLWAGPAIERWAWPQEEATAALARLVDADWPVAIVSNADGTVEESLRLLGVCQVGDGDGASVLHITDSRVVGVHKPDPAIFTDVLVLMAERSIGPEQCLYVGDTRSADVVGAMAANMQVVQIDPYGLYGDHDHPRATSVADVVDRLLASD
jgi:FMN phosphatase YigB (HAD superfamily)